MRGVADHEAFAPGLVVPHQRQFLAPNCPPRLPLLVCWLGIDVELRSGQRVYRLQFLDVCLVFVRQRLVGSVGIGEHRIARSRR